MQILEGCFVVRHRNVLYQAHPNGRAPRGVARPLHLFDQRHHVVRQTCVEKLDVRDAFLVRIRAATIEEFRHVAEASDHDGNSDFV
jgi:hypothetical protein